MASNRKYFSEEERRVARKRYCKQYRDKYYSKVGANKPEKLKVKTHFSVGCLQRMTPEKFAAARIVTGKPYVLLH